MQRPLLVEAYDEYAQVPLDMQGCYPPGEFEGYEGENGYIQYEGEEDYDHNNEGIEEIGNAELIQLQKEMQGSGAGIEE